MDKDLTKAIDIYRGFLAQYVILAHVIPALFPGILGVPGTLAVWCFFVVSGYLNYMSLYRRPEAIPYFKRRIVRLYPLLIISFVVIAAIKASLLINDFYTLIPAAFWLKAHMPFNGVLWTIIIELQLYLLSPFIVSTLLKFPLKKSMILASSIILPLLSILISVLVSKAVTGSTDLDDRTFLSALPLYFFGMLLAQAYVREIKLEIFKNALLPVIAICLFILVVTSRNSDLIGWQSLFLEGRYIPVLLTAFILNRVDLFRRFSYTGMPVRFGQLTYEIYLFHGLFAFMLYQITSSPVPAVILLFLWVLPVTTAFLYDFCSKFYIRKAIAS